MTQGKKSILTHTLLIVVVNGWLTNSWQQLVCPQYIGWFYNPNYKPY